MQVADRLVLNLREPIKLAELEFTEFILTEPTGEQLLVSYKATLPIEQLITLIAQNAGVPPAAVKKMRQRDLQRADDFFSAFGRPSTSVNSGSTPQS